MDPFVLRRKKTKLALKGTTFQLDTLYKVLIFLFFLFAPPNRLISEPVKSQNLFNNTLLTFATADSWIVVGFSLSSL